MGQRWPVMEVPVTWLVGDHLEFWPSEWDDALVSVDCTCAFAEYGESSSYE